MFTRRTTQPWILLAMAVLLPLAAACSDDETTGPAADPLIGAWQVTSFQAEGMDFIALGMTMRITLTAAKTYTVIVSGDLIGTCDPVANCTETGSYSSTSTQLTIDPGTADAVTFNYSITGATMTFTGDIDGTAVTIVLQKL